MYDEEVRHCVAMSSLCVESNGEEVGAMALMCTERCNNTNSFTAA